MLPLLQQLGAIRATKEDANDAKYLLDRAGLVQASFEQLERGSDVLVMDVGVRATRILCT